MNKMIFILLLAVLGTAAPDFCSAYCVSCSGITNLDCLTCPANFAQVSGQCKPNPTTETIFLETFYSTSTFSETRTWTCGRFDKIPGMYPQKFSVTLYNSAILPHYSIRILSFVLWIDNWGPSSLATMTLDGTVVGTAKYVDGYNGGNQCKKNIDDYSSRIDTGYVTHTSLTANIALSVNACLDPSACDWATKQLIILIMPCHSYCLMCTGTANTQCSSCASPYLLSGTTCSSGCLPAYYQVDTQNCAPCAVGCSACSVSATNCSACYTGYYLYGACFTSCPAGTYINGLICSNCSSVCTLCTGNPSPCSACVANYYLHLSQCLASCPVSFYPDNSTWTCIACNTSCLVCDVSATNCSSCKSGYVYYALGNACPSVCPNGFYNSSGVCQACNGSCLKCTGNPSPCSACTSGFFLSGTTCITTCPSGTYPDTTTATCVTCDTNCLTCQGPSTNCTSCINALDYFPLTNICLLDCPAGYYEALDNTCYLCDTGCQFCYKLATNCSSCLTGYFLSGTLCPSTCPVGYYGNTFTNECVTCSSQCLTCNGTQTNCTSCITARVWYAQTFTCPATCPVGWYEDTALNQCFQCDTSCSACTALPSPCSACNTGYFLDVNVCGTTCPGGTYANTATKICTTCDAACTACTNTATNCTACVTASVWYAATFSCLSSCPVGWYEDVSINQCVLCDTSCSACTASPSPCSACNAGYFLSGTVCGTTCPAGTYANTVTHTCDTCDTACTACTNTPTNCSACASTFYLTVASFTCTSTCPSTLFYPDTTLMQCVPCDIGCIVCLGPSTKCTSCQPTYYYYASSFLCTLACPALTTGISTFICIDCDPTCLVCTNTAVNCSSCVASSVLFPSNFTCITACPPGYFENSSNICQGCDISCQTCTGSPSPCQYCNSGYFLFNQACGTTCPAGTYPNSTLRSCEPCHSNCTVCTFNAVTCTACSSGFWLHVVNSTCINSCPLGYYTNATDGTCWGRFCSAYCNSGYCTYHDWNKCTNNCPGNYAWNSTSTSCYPQWYYSVLAEPGNTTMNSNVSTLNTCGRYTNMPGLFGPSESILIYNDTIVQRHYRLRVRAAFIFIDDWTSTNWLSINVDGTDYAKVTYNQPSIIQQECYGTTPEKGFNMDTGDYGHTRNGALILFKSSACTDTASCRWMYRQAIIMILPCHMFCLTCNGINSNNCFSCANLTTGNYLLSNNTCALTCHPEFYQTGPNTCTMCLWNCTRCNGSSTNCTVCRTGYLFKADDNSCPKVCNMVGYFQTATTCQKCYYTCQACTSSTVCQSCLTGYYFYNNFCYAQCPSPLFNDNYTMTCLTAQQYYVWMTVNPYFPSGDTLNFDISFSQPIDFTTFPYLAFQDFNFSSQPTISAINFDIAYTILGSSSYRIQLVPKDFTFLDDQQITMYTMNFTTIHQSIYGRPFWIENYNQVYKQPWTYIKISPLPPAQQAFYNAMVDVSTTFNNNTSGPFIQELKKSGLALLLANSIQITSCMLLVNTVLPKNMFEGIRFFASWIFYDVPPYQMESTKQKYFVVPTTGQMASRRMLFTTLNNNPALNETNFRRTGWTGYFLFDAYPQVIMIAIVIVLLIPTYIYRKTKYGNKMYGYLHSALHKLVDIAILYFTLSFLFDFNYFQDKPLRYVSLILCILCNLGLFLYELYRYYDIARYPYIEMSHPDYSRYAQLYGGFLKYIRYIPRKKLPRQKWYNTWVNPCTYHLVSYIKKFLMMLSLAFFYQRPQVQTTMLIIIQVAEIVRFTVVWPFRSKIYNVIRLLLQFVLLGVFIIMAVLVYLLQKILLIAPNVGPEVDVFYLLGWVGCCLVVLFNSSFILIFFYDFYLSCRWSNRELMDQTRKDYYANLIGKFEKGNEQVPLRLQEDWADCGQVDKEKQRKMKCARILIEQYEITRDDEVFRVNIDKTITFEKKPKFKYINNSQFLTPKKTVQHERLVDVGDDLYVTFRRTWDRWAQTTTFTLVVQTFVYVDEKSYKVGHAVELDKEQLLEYEVVMREMKGKQEKRVVKEKVEELPIDNGIIKKLYLL